MKKEKVEKGQQQRIGKKIRARKREGSDKSTNKEERQRGQAREKKRKREERERSKRWEEKKQIMLYSNKERATT